MNKDWPPYLDLPKKKVEVPSTKRVLEDASKALNDIANQICQDICRHNCAAEAAAEGLPPEAVDGIVGALYDAHCQSCPVLRMMEA